MLAAKMHTAVILSNFPIGETVSSSASQDGVPRRYGPPQTQRGPYGRTRHARRSGPWLDRTSLSECLSRYGLVSPPRRYSDRLGAMALGCQSQSPYQDDSRGEPTF